MRRTMALLALLAIAAFWTGCAADKGSSPATNSAATNSAAPESSGPSNANRNPSSATTGAPPPTTTATPAAGIKPPMKNGNQ